MSILACVAIAAACAGGGGSGVGVGGGGGQGSAAAIVDNPALFGYVWVDDSTKAVGATVYTDPASRVTVTDTAGYFQIDEDLQRVRYSVEAELRGIRGKTDIVEPLITETGPLHIFLGWESTITIGGIEAGGIGLNTTRPPINSKVRRYSGL